MKISTKALLFLSDEDPAHVEDIAYALYKETNADARRKTYSILRALRNLGWKIRRTGRSRRGWSVPEYIINHKHYELIQYLGEDLNYVVPMNPNNAELELAHCRKEPIDVSDRSFAGVS